MARKKRTLEEVFERLRTHGGVVVHRGAGAEEMRDAQAVLGRRFPATYGDFVRRFGWAEIEGRAVCGLGPDAAEPVNVLEVACYESAGRVMPPMWSYLLPLMADGPGRHECLDTRKPKGGDCPVVLWDRADGEFQRCRRVAPSFIEWLDRKLERAGAIVEGGPLTRVQRHEVGVDHPPSSGSKGVGEPRKTPRAVASGVPDGMPPQRPNRAGSGVVAARPGRATQKRARTLDEVFDRMRLRQDVATHRGVGVEELRNARGLFNRRLPAAYAKFVRVFGWARIGDDTVYGLGPDAVEAVNVVEVACREGGGSVIPVMLSHLIPLMKDHAGDHHCLDTRKVKDGDCPVVLWDHAGEEFQRCRRVAPSFVAWLDRKLDGEGAFGEGRPSRTSIGLEPGGSGPPPRASGRVGEPRLPPLRAKEGTVADGKRPRRSGRACDGEVAARAAKGKPKRARTLDEVFERMRSHQGVVMHRGARAKEMRDAQRVINLRFPASYALFLRQFGWADVGGDALYGLGPDAADAVNVVEVSRDERGGSVIPPMLSHLIPLMNDGAGNHYCLDTRKTKDGECPVVLWDHEGEEFQRCERVAPSFAAWLDRKLHEAVDA